MIKLNEFVITTILTKKSDKIDEGKYSAVIAALDKGQNVSGICNYVFIRAREECLRIYGEVTPLKVMALMDFAFCVESAFQYITFLQNNHEYIEYEYRR